MVKQLDLQNNRVYSSMMWRVLNTHKRVCDISVDTKELCSNSEKFRLEYDTDNKTLKVVFTICAYYGRELGSGYTVLYQGVTKELAKYFTNLAKTCNFYPVLDIPEDKQYLYNKDNQYIATFKVVPHK